MSEEFRMVNNKGVTEVSFDNRKFVFVSREMLKIVNELAGKIAPHDINILITGQTGVGKDVLAEIIHYLSERQGSFVNCNISGLSVNLFESELFGYIRGAFTGAGKNSPGYFKVAHKGTLLLNEIGDLAPGSQVKILTAIESKRIYPVGSQRADELDVRIISITNQSPGQLMAEAKLRPDLFYRLRGFLIHIPSLKERKEDILILAKHFIEKSSQKFDKENVALSKEAKSYILDYSWPGNVRELDHVIEQAVFMADNGVLEEDNLRQVIKESLHQSNAGEEAQSTALLVDISPPFSLINFLKLQRNSIEKKAIILALEECHQNKSAAARMLNVDRRDLYYRMKRLDII